MGCEQFSHAPPYLEEGANQVIVLKEKSKLAENNLRIFISAVIKVIKPSSSVSGYIESSALDRSFKAALSRTNQGLVLGFDNMQVFINNASDLAVFENGAQIIAGSIQSVTLTNHKITFWGIIAGNREITICINI